MSARPSFVVEDQSEVIAFLERKLVPARRIDTHGAVVFLAGDRAYKLKRAVKFPYMDFSTAERRKAMCEAEIAINRRLAPEIYLDVEEVRIPSGSSDWLVVMRRFDEDGLFDRMAERGALTPALMAALGVRIARFHDGLAAIREGFGRPESYHLSIAADVRQMLEQGDRLDAATSRLLAREMPAALEAHTELVSRRVEAGAIRRCHGDLHLRNIVLIDGKPVPFDAIEFSERIANIDVLYDLSFALMDLCERGLRPLANRLLNEWLWRTEELPHASHEAALALLPMFLSRRAAIRAFVDAQSAAVSEGEMANNELERARTYQRLALSFLRPNPPALTAIGGLSGSGKTTTALREAPAIGRSPGAVVVRSDVERKRLAGVALEERMPAGSYTPEASDRVYAGIMARAEKVLRSGHSAILDAVFARPAERAMAEALAKRVGAPFHGIWLEVPKDVAQARVAARSGDASDATPQVVERQFGYELGDITWERQVTR
jgi:aminoglycoside phosphotransferase family enzyme/predicted kinase